MFRTLVQKFVLIISLFFVKPSIIPYNSNQIIWQYDEFWINCLNLETIAPINCGNEYEWKECYQIPSEGICMRKSFQINENLMSQQLQLQVELFSQSLKQINIQIQSGVLQTFQVAENQTSYIANIELKSTLINISIFNVDIPVQIGRFQLYNNSLPYCLNFSSNMTCTKCQNEYFLYNYQCQPYELLNLISMIGTSKCIITTIIEKQSIIAKIQLPGLRIGELLIPKIFLRSNLESDQIIYYLLNKDVRFETSDTVIFTIPISSNLSRTFETDQFYVQNYYINFLITASGITQYMLQSIFTLSINKMVTSEVGVRKQDVKFPSTCCSEFNIEVFSNVRIISMSIVNELLQLRVNQSIEDPEFQNYNIIVESARMMWIDTQGQSNQAQLQVNENSIELYAGYILMNLSELTVSNVSFSNEVQVRVNSYLNIKQRILQQNPGFKSNLKFQYIMLTEANIKNKQMTITNNTNNEVQIQIYIFYSKVILKQQSSGQFQEQLQLYLLFL